MSNEVSILFAQLAEFLTSIPFVSIIGVSFVISFFMAILNLWKGGD